MDFAIIKVKVVKMDHKKTFQFLKYARASLIGSPGTYTKLNLSFSQIKHPVCYCCMITLS